MVFLLAVVACRSSKISEAREANGGSLENADDRETLRAIRDPGIQRPFIKTGKLLDVAIDGVGFFQVQFPGGSAFTRDGNFQVLSNGVVATQDGFFVLSGFHPISPEPQEITISRAGKVAMISEMGGTWFRLTLHRFANPAALEPLGNNLYRATQASGNPMWGLPGENGFGEIVQGFLEDHEGPDSPISSLALFRRAVSANFQDRGDTYHLWSEDLNRNGFLDLSGAQEKVKDEQLVHLKDFPRLWELDLRGSQVTDAGLVHLEGLTELSILSLSCPGITDAGLAHLKGLIKLKVLWLTDTQVTGAGLVHLKDLTRLRTLNLRDAQVTDAGLVHLEGLTNLTQLDLRGAQVTDEGLFHLKGLTQLLFLQLSASRITDAGLAHIRGLTKLAVLSFNDTPVTDVGLVHLKGLTKLRYLFLNGTQVTNKGRQELLRAIPGLEIHYEKPELDTAPGVHNSISVDEQTPSLTRRREGAKG